MAIKVVSLPNHLIFYSMDEFVLAEKKGNEEFHLFVLNVRSQDVICSLTSACGKMISADIAKIVFKSKTEDEARILCALQGKEVCGICAGILYTLK